MATYPNTLASPLSAAPGSAARERRFFGWLFAGIGVFILAGFAQFDLRNNVDVLAMPWVVHAHAAAMLAWLALAATQPFLAGRGTLALHRRLGWLGAALSLAIPLFAVATAVWALRAGAFPPFFTASYFLALVLVEATAFTGMVAWAVAAARRTDWHRRLLAGAMAIVMEPALGRLLPVPLLGGMDGWIEMVLQIGMLALVLQWDRKTLGRAHPATLWSMGAVAATHVLVATLAILPPFGALAEVVSAG